MPTTLPNTPTPPTINPTGLLSWAQVDAACAWLTSIGRTDLVHFAGAAWRNEFDATVTRLSLRTPGASEAELRRAARAIHYPCPLPAAL